MSETKKTKRPYVSPRVKSEGVQVGQVLLICSGAYNCIDEVGYDCCAPSASNCFDPGQC